MFQKPIDSEQQTVARDLRAFLCNTSYRDKSIQRGVSNRVSGYMARLQYLIWNIAGLSCVAVFPETAYHQAWVRFDWKFLLIFHFLQFTAISLYFAVSLSNPGYIPKDSVENHSEKQSLISHEAKISSVSTSSSSSSSSISNPLLSADASSENSLSQEPSVSSDVSQEKRKVTSESKQNDLDYIANFCYKCEFVRPIRSKHCHTCGRCVAKFDHHCPVTGNCIGGLNHRYFLSFVTTQWIVVAWGISMGFTSLISGNMTERGPAGWMGRIGLLFGLGMGIFVLSGLASFHMYLACTNQTTREIMRPNAYRSYDREAAKRKEMEEKEKRETEIEMMTLPNGETMTIENESATASARTTTAPLNAPPIDSSDGSSSDGYYFDQKPNTRGRVKRISRPRRKMFSPRGKNSVSQPWFGERTRFDRGLVWNFCGFCRAELESDWVCPTFIEVDEEQLAAAKSRGVMTTKFGRGSAGDLFDDGGFVVPVAVHTPQQGDGSESPIRVGQVTRRTR